MDKKVYEFISTKTSDPIIERKTCAVSGQAFAIFQSDLDFYKKISPVFNGVKYAIPTPTLCPEQRQRRRLLFRNERALYKRKCDATGKNIIALYPPDSSYTVYDQSYRRSDARDPMDYGKPFDFSKSFMEQFIALHQSVPRLSLMVDTACENCEYTNQVTNCKDSYLIVSCSDAQSCLYSKRVNNSKDIVDSLFCVESNNCYGCIDIVACHTCISLQDCIHCSESSFLYDCDGCQSCFLCTHLRNKKYCIFNIQYTQEEYADQLKKYHKEYTFPQLLAHYQKLITDTYRKHLSLTQTEQTYGNNVQFAKDCAYLSDASHVQNVKYGQYLQDCKEMQDCDYNCCDSALGYELSTGGIDLYHCSFGIDVWPNVQYLLYCDTCCSGSKHLLGCVGLRNKQYCILNTQYTQQEYETLVPQIIEKMKADGEWGEFFPSHVSPFGYNETVAQESFPLTREEALAKGYAWQDARYDPQLPDTADTLSGEQIPLESTLVSDEILKKIFICEVSGRPFRIIKQELEFYRKHHLPLPRKHPDVRHMERIQQRQGNTLHLKNCDKCWIEMLSVYPSDYQGKVYCEECYNKEIYG